MSVPFTQYMMPDGRKEPVWIVLAEETEAKAQEILSKGFVFECEMLSDYSTVSFTITHPTLDDGEPFDVAQVLAKNGPAAIGALTRLIVDFDPDKDYTLS